MASVAQITYKIAAFTIEIEPLRVSMARNKGCRDKVRYRTTYWLVPSLELCTNPISPYQDEQSRRLIEGSARYLRASYNHLVAGVQVDEACKHVAMCNVSDVNDETNMRLGYWLFRAPPQRFHDAAD